MPGFVGLTTKKNKQNVGLLVIASQGRLALAGRAGQSPAFFLFSFFSFLFAFLFFLSYTNLLTLKIVL